MQRIKDRRTVMRYHDKTADFLATARPDTGQIHDYTRLLSPKEAEAAQWLKRNIGGSIVAVPRAEIDGIKTPDLLWNGKSLEIKHTHTSLSALDKALRRAKHQTDAGGVLVDITGSTYTDEEAITQTLYRLNRSGGRFAILFRCQKLVAYVSE